MSDEVPGFYRVSTIDTSPLLVRVPDLRAGLSESAKATIAIANAEDRLLNAFISGPYGGSLDDPSAFYEITLPDGEIERVTYDALNNSARFGKNKARAYLREAVRKYQANRERDAASHSPG